MDEAALKQVETYVTSVSKAPFEDWLSALRDTRARARIKMRLDRLRMGNPGDCRSVGVGVHELRIDYGPGYRVYVAYPNATSVLVLWGGDKDTQPQDIAKAQTYWEDYQKRIKEARHGEAE